MFTFAAFEVLIVVALDVDVVWDAMPYGPLKVSRCFGGAFRRCLRGQEEPARSRWKAWLIRLIP
jgi:hypothetical protein